MSEPTPEPKPSELTPELIADEPLLQLFAWEHLPAHLQERSSPFGRLAIHVVKSTPRNPERSTALRKLREAKDCAVTAHIWKTPTTEVR